MYLFRLAIVIASVLLVNAAYVSNNLTINYNTLVNEPFQASSFRVLAVKVEAKPNADGSCYIHKMASGETCQFLMDKFTNVKSVDNLNSWNTNTPGWQGCDNGHPWAGDEVCVSTGGYPDKRPSKNSDGSCATYTVVSGSNCDAIAKKYAPLSVDDINKYNAKTYGWKGCNYLQIDQKICVSDGTPPKPTPNPKAECGPLAPGDLYNTECPLNACCSEFGFCGLTSEFCATKESDTNAPGTTGCFSNCGYGKLGTSPASTFKNIIYWMDTNGNLGSDPSELSDYTHIYYAFAIINSDFSISVDFPTAFLNASPRKVVSFGGWDFSTSPSTYSIFRNIVSNDANIETFATNAVNLINKYNLAGIDLDWEYPGEPDIPGIPADIKNDGDNYLKLIKSIKSKLNGDQILSIALPASYWYLKAFPVKEMQDYVNWFIFMTYDFHGSWEVGSESDPAVVQCHTNQTEITTALQMLAKAEIKSYKIMGGIATYGRSFKLESNDCYNVGCSFVGPGDQGSSSFTAGILTDYEINDIASSSSKDRRWTDSKSNCDFMQYDTDNVVGWNKAGQRTTNINYFKEVGCGGTVTWAANYLSHSGSNTYKSYQELFNCTDDSIDLEYYCNFIPYNETNISNLSKRSVSKYDLQTFLYILNIMKKRLAGLSELTDLHESWSDMAKAVVLLAYSFKYNSDSYNSEAQKEIKKRASVIEYNIYNIYTQDNENEGLFFNDVLNALFPTDDKYLTVLRKNENNYLYQKALDIENFASKKDSNSGNLGSLDSIPVTYGDMDSNWEVANRKNIFGSVNLIKTIWGFSEDLDLSISSVEKSTDNYIPMSNDMVYKALDLGDSMYERNSIIPGEDFEPMESYAEDICYLNYNTKRGLNYKNKRSDEDNCIENSNIYRITENTATSIRNAVDKLGYEWEENCEYPVYVVNLNNESPGVACNVLAYYSDKNLKSNIFSRRISTDKDRAFLAAYKQPNAYFQDGENTPDNDYRYQKDEFPFNSVQENDRSISNVHVSYILSKDNRKDGLNLGKFYLGAPTNKYNQDTHVKNNDYSHCIPNDNGSASRGPIKTNDKYLVLFYLEDDVDCSKHAWKAVLN